MFYNTTRSPALNGVWGTLVCVSACMHIYPGVSAVVTTVKAFLHFVTMARFPKQHTFIHIRLLQKHLPLAYMLMSHVFPDVSNDTIHLMYDD